MLLGVYVDDIVTVCENDAEKDAFVAELDTGDLKDRVKDEGIMRWCLGMEVIQDFTAGTATLCQRRYLVDCLAAA